MLIGELADRAGTSTRALRYYEQQGLVRPARSSSGYRVYDEQELQVVRKIRALLELGFDLADTRPFVTCLRAGYRSGDECPDSVESLRRKLSEVDEAMGRLAEVRERLREQLAEPLCEFTYPAEPTGGERP
ncbi:MerR family transcriptional regulator [Nocardia wallacei]|uniref:MerR family transcriptional regulator n=1 Tax=Nocardia wallacei TaxID=480035 RepID=A0A7G1KG20_9NOCA|nr:MerR family transcriptional regulator [Nocardia wallacei]BCK54252.1 MerR family transcriptional regulator [Nocardia wallacei]